MFQLINFHHYILWYIYYNLYLCDIFSRFHWLGNQIKISRTFSLGHKENYGNIPNGRNTKYDKVWVLMAESGATKFWGIGTSSKRIYMHTTRNGFGFIECFMTTFLLTHSWLNWVDEDDWRGWGWPERKARSKSWSTRSAGKGLEPNYWDCGLWKAQVRHTWRHLAAGVKYPGQVAPTTGSLILVPPRPKEEVFKVFLT